MEDTVQGPAENLPEPLVPAVAVEAEEDGAGDEFSFPVPPVATDACIVPVYPIFGRPPSPPPRREELDEPETATVRVPLGRLLLEEREFRAREQEGRSASARAWQEDDEDDAASGGAGDEGLEGVPPESYCLWAPGGQSPPRRCRKSGSTGSVLRWRRISDRLVGRSHSDGKEKFVFLAAVREPPPRPSNKAEEEGGGGISRGGGDAGSRRRSYLPYKQELVGLFANVSGLRRSYHPF